MVMPGGAAVPQGRALDGLAIGKCAVGRAGTKGEVLRSSTFKEPRTPQKSLENKQ